MTQYERDFERISAVIRKEVMRFEVRLAQPSGSLAWGWPRVTVAPAPALGAAVGKSGGV